MSLGSGASLLPALTICQNFSHFLRIQFLWIFNICSPAPRSYVKKSRPREKKVKAFFNDPSLNFYKVLTFFIGKINKK